MSILAVFYYLSCHGLVLAGLIFSFIIKPRGDEPRGRWWGFRALLLSVGLGSAGMTYGYFQAGTAGIDLNALRIFSLLSLFGAAGLIASIPLFLSTFLRHRGGKGVIALFSIIGALSIPLSPVLIFGQGIPGLAPLTEAAGTFIAVSLACSIAYGISIGAMAYRRRSEASGMDKAWAVTILGMLVSSLVLSPLTILNDFMQLPLMIWKIRLPDALPLMATAWSLVFIAARLPSLNLQNGPAHREAGDAETAWSNARLTPRETEVARLLVSGYSYRGIAERLGISAATVKSHILKAYEKTGAGNKIELLRFADREEGE